MSNLNDAFDLATTYVQLDDGPAAVAVEVDDRFWEALEAGQTCIVPKGVWHSANVREPGDTLHITRGDGTLHRPR